MGISPTTGINREEGISPLSGIGSEGVALLPGGGGYVGPLDLVPSAIVAYSVRALSAAMLGQNIFRLRRDSDDSEMDFAANAVTGDAPTADITTWLGGANGFVVTWYDQSGNAKNVTNATAASQPAFSVAGGVNSKPCVAVTSSNNGYLVSTDINLVSGEYAFFTVANGTEFPFIFDNGSFEDYVYVQKSANFMKIRSSSDAATNGSGGSTVAISGISGDKLFDGTWKYGNFEFRDAGVSIAEDTSYDLTGLTTNITKPLYIGGGPDYGPSADEKTSELIFYAAEKDNATRTPARINIATYYGITL